MAPTHSFVRTLSHHSGSVMMIATVGNDFFSGGSDGKIVKAKLSSSEITVKKSEVFNGDFVAGVALAPSGAFLVAHNYNSSTIKIFSTLKRK